MLSIDNTQYIVCVAKHNAAVDVIVVVKTKLDKNRQEIITTTICCNNINMNLYKIYVFVYLYVYVCVCTHTYKQYEVIE